MVLTGNRDAANDLAQASCLRALENAEKFDPDTHLDRWLFTIAKRTWLNELRALTIRRGGGLVSVDSFELVDTNPNQETNRFVREVLKEIYTLPEAQREAVLLVYGEGFAYSEAAHIIGIPIGTVMSRLAAARKTIAERLKEEND